MIRRWGSIVWKMDILRIGRGYLSSIKDIWTTKKLEWSGGSQTVESIRKAAI